MRDLVRAGSRWRAAAAVLEVALVASACGAASSKSAPTGPDRAASKVVLDSVQLTASEKSARVVMTLSTSGASGSSSGLVDFSTGDGQMDFRVRTAAASMTDFVLRTVNGVVYVRLPATVARRLGTPPGVRWLWIATSSIGTAPSAIPGAGEGDPNQLLASLERVSNNVTTVGTDQVRGVTSTHYHALVDFEKAIDKAKVPAGLRKSLNDAFAKASPNARSVPVDVWVDGNGLVRRVTVRIGANAVTVDYFDFGVPVNLEAPPDNSVAPLDAYGG